MKYFITNFYIPKEEACVFGNGGNLWDKTLTDEIDDNVLVVTPSQYSSNDNTNKYFSGTECVLTSYFVCLKNSDSTITDAKETTVKCLNYLGFSNRYFAFAEEACLSKLHDKINCTFNNLGRGVIRSYNLIELVTAWDDPHFIKDNVLSDKCIKRYLKNTKETFCSKAISKEKNNIISSQIDDSNGIIPVHYIIEGSEKAEFTDCLNSFASVLISNGRINSHHIFNINFDLRNQCFYRCFGHGHAELSEIITDNMANSLSGNIVVVNYGLYDNEDEYYSENYYAFCKFIELLKPYLDKTQLIVAIPSSKPQLQMRIKKLVNFPMVLINQNNKPAAQSNNFKAMYKYLEGKAYKDNMHLDKDIKNQLLSKLTDKSNWDIDKFYKDWKTSKQINNYYPQYKEQLEEFIALQNQKIPNSLDKLDAMIGLDHVKREIKNILHRYKLAKYAETRGIPAESFSLHMAFMGNPGTGKTEVANLLGQIFKEAGILTEGRVIFNSGCVMSATINQLFKDNHGSVLFFDEAYDFIGSDSITTLISNMERYRNDTIVILAGYEPQMNVLLHCNPGFKSRIGNILKFPDYSNDELYEIFKLMCKQGKKLISSKSLSDINDIICRGGKPNDQGNARYIRNLYEQCVNNQQVRLAKQLELNPSKKIAYRTLQTITKKDIPLQLKNTKSAWDELNEMIGLQKVKTTVSKRINFAVAQKYRRDNNIYTEYKPFNMVFLGNPGTGKTEVARLIGKILSEEGILSVGKLFNTDSSMFKEPEMVNSLFEQAKGSIIFVDEAYTLHQLHPAVLGNFMKNMEDYREEVVVIFAGYTKEIEALLQANPGFMSRITTLIQFDDYKIDELVDITKLLAKKQNYDIDKNAIPEIRKAILENMSKKHFGNARFVRTLLEEAEINHGHRLKTEIIKQGLKPSITSLKTLKKCDFYNLDCINTNIKHSSIGFDFTPSTYGIAS